MGDRTFGRRKDIVWVALVACALAVPAAIADEAGTASLKKDVAKALKSSKVAKKKAKTALGIAKETSQQQGPEGPEGPRGPQGSQGAKGAPGADAINVFNGGTYLQNDAGAEQRAPLVGWIPEAVQGPTFPRVLSPNRQISLSEFGVEVDAPLAAGNSLVVAVLVDELPTAPQMTCTIPQGGTSCESNATVAVPPRSALTLQATFATSSNESEIGWSVTVE